MAAESSYNNDTLEEVRQSIYALGFYACERVNEALRRKNDQAHGTTTLGDELAAMSPAQEVGEKMEFLGTPVAQQVMGLFYGPTGGYGAANRLAYAKHMGIETVLARAREDFQQALVQARLFDRQLDMDGPSIADILRKAGTLAETGDMRPVRDIITELETDARGR